MGGWVFLSDSKFFEDGFFPMRNMQLQANIFIFQ